MSNDIQQILNATQRAAIVLVDVSQLACGLTERWRYDEDAMRYDDHRHRQVGHTQGKRGRLHNDSLWDPVFKNDYDDVGLQSAGSCVFMSIRKKKPWTHLIKCLLSCFHATII